jgi:hypothetical protein
MSATWINQLQAFAESRGRTTWQAPNGIGIDFVDGYDACWFLLNEVTSTIPLSEEPNDIEPLVREFLDLEGRRQQALTIIRQVLIDQHIATRREKSGDWSIQLKGGAYSSISVGARLTYLLRQNPSMEKVIASFLEGTCIRKLYAARMKRYLELKTADADLPWQDDTAVEYKSNLASVLGWMGVCKLIKKIGDTHGDETQLPGIMEMAKEVKPKGRVAEMLLAMNEQLPNVEASLEITTGNIDLQFDDGFDSFEIDLRSRKVVELIKQSGPRKAASALVDEYRLYNSQRSRLLTVFKLTAQKLGWKWESGYQHWYFGASLREVAIPFGEELTKALQSSGGDTAGAIKVLLSTDSAFKQACLELISQETLDAPTISSTPLLPYIVQAPKLVSLTPDVVSKMDAFHQRSLSDHLASDRGLYCYLDRLRYEPRTDTWAKAEDWLLSASRGLTGEYVPHAALLVLLDNDDARARPLLKTHLHESMLAHDVDDAAAHLAWRHRNLLPELGKVWFEPCYDNVPYSEYRQRLGDPIAIRQLVVETDFDALNIVEWPTNITRMIAEQWITSVQRSKYREQLLHWAKTHYQWEQYRDGPFASAWALNLPEVMDALEANPYLTEFLLCYNDKRELFAEPGIYFAENMLLYWSLLKPTKLLTQIIASTDPQVFRQANRGTATSLRNLGVDQEELLNHWYRSLKIPLAIAWHRCRQAGVV